jgi:hypothetical protein
MKRSLSLNLTVIALGVLLVSCNEKGSDFFKRVNPSDTSLTGNSPAIGIVGEDHPGSETGESTGGTATSGGTSVGSTTGGTTQTPPTSEKDMCEVLKDDGEDIVYGYGLAGKIYDGAPEKIQNFKELLAKGKVLEGTLYMSKLNIPTTKFEKGFPREDGTLLMNSMGQVLIENFGVEFTGNLQLTDGDEEGYYEIGIIADDGVSLDVVKQEADKNLIDGDHQTPSKFFCSKLLVRMEKNTLVPIRLRWFQGPRYHIALIMMWRKVEALSSSSDSLMKSQLKNPVKETRCGIAGNNFFFDPESDSHPQMEYLDLFDPAKRAVPWSIIKHKNYKLPAGSSNRDCVSKTP